MKRKRPIDRKRVYRDKSEDIDCFCVYETRFEDFTFRSLGQELTRNIETDFCSNCKTKYYDGPTIIKMDEEIQAKVLALAKERLNFPENHNYLRYDKDKNILLISYSNYETVRRESDSGKEIIYYFDSHNELVRIEVLNFYKLEA